MTMLQLVGAIAGLKIGEAIGAKRHYRNFLAALKVRGTPDTLRTAYRIDDDALHVETDRL